MKSKKSAGFTLIEMIVVTAIIVMISGISVANFRAGEKRKRVTLAVDTLINAARNAQNFSLTGKNIATSPPPLSPAGYSGCAQGQSPKYYNIEYTTAQQINLYALDQCGTLVKIETYSFPLNTRLQANGLKIDNVSAASRINIYFSPPFGQMTAALDANASSNFTNVSITVESTDGTVSKTVNIDGVAGRIGE